ncbi:vomeronasal type-1 receptor 4-like [Dipodomys merriami]|uniref:vomeronasal type-1 receptor 4-like n=1 Tax=Dipodomys merriami TaxID=94247 RepID=UPI003855F0B7
MRATDLILRHLIVANFLSLLCRGVPQTIVAWGWRNFFNDMECKMVFYLFPVCRGVSIGSTCSLSIFLAISISQGDSRPKAQDNMTSLKAYGYCPSMRQDPGANVLNVAMLSVPDVLCLGLMLWDSTSMLFVLYRHKLRMRHIQSISTCWTVIYHPSPVLHHISVFAMGCFPALIPFLLMSGHSTPCSLLFTCTKKMKVILP